MKSMTHLIHGTSIRSLCIVFALALAMCGLAQAQTTSD